VVQTCLIDWALDSVVCVCVCGPDLFGWLSPGQCSVCVCGLDLFGWLSPGQCSVCVCGLDLFDWLSPGQCSVCVCGPDLFDWLSPGQCSVCVWSRLVHARHWHPGCQRCHQLWLSEAFRDVPTSHWSIRPIWTLWHCHQPHHLWWQVFTSQLVISESICSLADLTSLRGVVLFNLA